MASRHRTPLLSSLRSYPDPALSADLRIQNLAGQLSTLPAATSHAPSGKFRAELRQQLVSVAPRLIAESAEIADADPEPAPTRPPRPVQTPRWRKPFIAVLSTAALFVLLLGGAVWISGRAEPGDSLYSLKRTSENVQLSLTTGDTARGKSYLELATTRASEIATLLSRSTFGALGSGPPGTVGINSRTAGLVTDTLSAHDSDVRDASQLLGTQAVTSRSAAPLDAMISWAPGQLGRLQAIVDRIPAGPLHDRAQASLRLTEQARARAEQLKSSLTLPCLNQSSSDDLGPIAPTSCPAPVTGPQVRGSTAPSTRATGRSSQPAAASPTPPGATTTQPGGSQTSTGSGTASPTGSGSQSGTGPGSSSGSPTPSSILPSLTSPVTTNSCGVQLSLGPIGVGLGSCGLSIGLGH